MRNQLDDIFWFNNLRRQIPQVMLQRFQRALEQTLPDRPWWRDVGLPRLFAALALAESEMLDRFLGSAPRGGDAGAVAIHHQRKILLRAVITGKGKAPEGAPIDVLKYFQALWALERPGPDMNEMFLRACIVAAAQMVAKECRYTDADLVGAPIRRGAAETPPADVGTAVPS